MILTQHTLYIIFKCHSSAILARSFNDLMVVLQLIKIVTRFKLAVSILTHVSQLIFDEVLLMTWWIWSLTLQALAVMITYLTVLQVAIVLRIIHMSYMLYLLMLAWYHLTVICWNAHALAVADVLVGQIQIVLHLIILCLVRHWLIDQLELQPVVLWARS